MAAALQLRSIPAEPLSTSSSVNGKILRFITLGETLKHGAPLDPSSKAALVKLWTGTFEQIGEERFEAAFHKALLASPFRPDIADIRRFAGVITESPEQEAQEVLDSLIAAVRKFGPKLLPLRGELLNDGRDQRGLVLAIAEQQYAPSTPPPAFSALTESALVKFGFGSREEGLLSIAAHPAVPRKSEQDKPSPNFREREIKAIETRWIATYLLCKSRTQSAL